MKLLAGLLGCAAADYACCPYDDFGVVNPSCPLSEKTPWAMKDNNNNADPSGVENHLCKAWEANIDGTMEGNEDMDNWGGCGFQRHFGWGMAQCQDGQGTNPACEQCKMGQFDCSAANMANLVKGFDAGGAVFHMEQGGFSDGGANHVFGNVHLGGVCKLWIPVRLAQIDSVHIAGVHMNGGGTNANADNGAVSVFDDAKICDTNDCTGNTVSGTAYCFSVVNIGEFMENNMPNLGAFKVMNANVAGHDQGGHDPILLQGPTYWSAYDVDFGSNISPSNAGGGQDSIVDAGASFDVVVHFKSAWCIRHWTIVDMQTADDVNSGQSDYALAANAQGPQHAHTDVADKRFLAGVCGCCDGTNQKHDADNGAPSAEGCTPCAGCTEALHNSYLALVPGGMQWPNAGAWAAYYSFITCSDETFMIYEALASIDASTGAITATGNTRGVVHSMFYNDIRHDYSNNHMGTGSIVVRGNIRQIGDSVFNCGPGQIDTSDAKRCTWNWNFHLVGGQPDQETWFEKASPLNFAVWKSGAAVDRADEANTFVGAISHIVNTVSFVVTFQTDTDDAPADNGLTRAFKIDASKYFTAATSSITTAGHDWSFAMHCLRSSLDGNGAVIADPGDHAAIGDTGDVNIRDIFPDCYMGDEIHFEYWITGGDTAKLDHRISSWYSFVVPTFASD